MIYARKLLIVKLLLQNTSKRKLKGIYRPSAYLQESGSYCTALRLDLFKQEIPPGGTAIVTGILEAPVGFGESLKEGAVFELRNGIDPEAKGLVLEMLGYHA